MESDVVSADVDVDVVVIAMGDLEEEEATLRPYMAVQNPVMRATVATSRPRIDIILEVDDSCVDVGDDADAARPSWITPKPIPNSPGMAKRPKAQKTSNPKCNCLSRECEPSPFCCCNCCRCCNWGIHRKRKLAMPKDAADPQRVAKEACLFCNKEMDG